MSHQRLHPARRAAAAALCLSGLAVVSACGLVRSPVPVTTPPATGAPTSSSVHAPATFDDERVSGAADPAPMFRVAAPATAVPPTVTVSAVPAPGTTTTTTTTTAPRPPSPPSPPSPAKTTTTKPAAPKATTPAAPAPAPAPASGPAVTGCGNPNPGKVLLTFDDGGPTAPAILGILDRYGIKARWFPTGEWANGNAAFIARLEPTVRCSATTPTRTRRCMPRSAPRS